MAADGKSGVGDDELTSAAISTSPPSSADLYSESPHEIRLVFKGNGYLQDNIWEASDNTISLLKIAQVRDNQREHQYSFLPSSPDKVPAAEEAASSAAFPLTTEFSTIRMGLLPTFSSADSSDDS